MRKADYLTLARAIRLDVEKYPAFGPHFNQSELDYESAKSCAMQAINLARYLAQYLAVDKVEFLNACGVRP
jgi:hypothetical protein